MIIKNYKELCKVLEIKESGGNTKIKQLKELLLYCNYTKEGNKYIIKEVYKTPVITINDILKSKNNKYITILSNIILQYLYNNPEELKQIPLLQFMELLGVTNTNYKEGITYKKELSQLYNIQLASIYYFYNNTKNEYKKLIERCLNNLQNRSVLFWNKCIMIIDEDNKRVYKATEDIQKEIIDVQKETLQYLKLNNMYELMKDKHKLKEFNKIVYNETGYNYYYAYNVIIGNKAIKIEYNNILKNDLNNLIVNKTNNIFNKDIYYPFLSDYNKLIDILINNDTNNILELLKDKREENKKEYYKNKVIIDKQYIKDINKIENTYFDTYDR